MCEFPQDPKPQEHCRASEGRQSGEEPGVSALRAAVPEKGLAERLGLTEKGGAHLKPGGRRRVAGWWPDGFSGLGWQGDG